MGPVVTPALPSEVGQTAASAVAPAHARKIGRSILSDPIRRRLARRPRTEAPGEGAYAERGIDTDGAVREDGRVTEPQLPLSSR